MPAFSQIDTNLVRLSGIITSSSEGDQLPFVHIVNKRTRKGTISDTIGLFHIRIQPNDTLVFRSLGFEDNLLVLDEGIQSKVLFLEVQLLPKTYELEVVDVLALSRESQFRYDFTHMVPEDNSWEKQLIIPGVTKEKYQWIREEEKFNPKKSFTGPFSALYYQFSDEGKSLQKLALLLEEDAKREQAEEKFNEELLSDFTGYSGDTLFAFYRYLNFSVDFILESAPYDIFYKVQTCILGFEHQLQASNTLNNAE